MAGNKNSGRKRKPLAPRLADGTYRPSRHGTLPMRDAEVPLPEATEGLDEIEAEEYARLKGFKHLGLEDRSLVRAACELWALYRKALEVARLIPVDRDARTAVTAYHGQYRATLIALGIPPRERAKLDLMQKNDAPKIPTRQRA